MQPLIEQKWKKKYLCSTLCNLQRELANRPILFTRKCPKGQFRSKKDGNLHSALCSLPQIFMTPEDFLRSLTPGVKQPEGLGLDQFRKIDAGR